jgi:hypothetical protein
MSPQTPTQSQPIAPAVSAVAAGLKQAQHLLALSQSPDVLPQARDIFLSGLLSLLQESESELSKIAQLVATMEGGRSISIRINQPKPSAREN